MRNWTTCLQFAKMREKHNRGERTIASAFAPAAQPDQLRRGKRYRWRFLNDETLRSSPLLSKDKELDYNFPM